MHRYLWILAFALAVALSTAAPAPSAHRVAGVNAFVVRGLVSDGSLADTTVDSNLVNAWGLAASADGSLVDRQRGHRDEHGLRRNGAETGARGDRGRRPDRSCLQRHHRVRRDGRPGVGARALHLRLRGREDPRLGRKRPHRGSNATEVAVDNSHRGAVYRGLAQATASDGSTYLYAADFHNGRVDVFDANWRPITWKGAFVDRMIPAWYNEFGIQAIGGRIFVTYASPAPANGNDHRPAGTWTSST